MTHIEERERGDGVRVPRHAVNWTRRYAILVGFALVLGASVSSITPLRLPDLDRYGQPLLCGSALRPDTSVVRAEDQLNALRPNQNGVAFHPTDHAGACAAWIARTRGAALGAAAGGLAVITLALLFVQSAHRRQP